MWILTSQIYPAANLSLTTERGQSNIKVELVAALLWEYRVTHHQDLAVHGHRTIEKNCTVLIVEKRKLEKRTLTFKGTIYYSTN